MSFSRNIEFSNIYSHNNELLGGSPEDSGGNQIFGQYVSGDSEQESSALPDQRDIAPLNPSPNILDDDPPSLHHDQVGRGEGFSSSFAQPDVGNGPLVSGLVRHQEGVRGNNLLSVYLENILVTSHHGETFNLDQILFWVGNAVFSPDDYKITYSVIRKGSGSLETVTMTLLDYACLVNDTELVEKLFVNKCSVANNLLTLTYSDRIRHDKFIEKLVEGYTALDLAYMHGNKDVITLLEEKGAITQKVGDLSNLDLKKVSWSRLGTFDRKFIYGVMQFFKDSPEEVVRLLSECTDHFKGNEHYSFFDDKTEGIYKFLLDVSRNDELAQYLFMCMEAQPLFREMFVDSVRDSSLIQKYLAAGGDINAKDRARHTFLNRAAREGNIELVKFLVERGANMDLQDREGDTPLLQACKLYSPSYKVVKYLLEQGADPQIENRKKKKPLDHVKGIRDAPGQRSFNRYSQILPILEQYTSGERPLSVVSRRKGKNSVQEEQELLDGNMEVEGTSSSSVSNSTLEVEKTLQGIEDANHDLIDTCTGSSFPISKLDELIEQSIDLSNFMVDVPAMKDGKQGNIRVNLFTYSCLRNNVQLAKACISQGAPVNNRLYGVHNYQFNAAGSLVISRLGATKSSLDLAYRTGNNALITLLKYNGAEPFQITDSETPLDPRNLHESAFMRILIGTMRFYKNNSAKKEIIVNKLVRLMDNIPRTTGYNQPFFNNDCNILYGALKNNPDLVDYYVRLIKGSMPFRDYCYTHPGFLELSNLESYLRAGGDLNLTDSTGSCLCCVADRKKKFEVIIFLLESGAKLTLNDRLFIRERLKFFPPDSAVNALLKLLNNYSNGEGSSSSSQMDVEQPPTIRETSETVVEVAGELLSPSAAEEPELPIETNELRPGEVFRELVDDEGFSYTNAYSRLVREVGRSWSTASAKRLLAESVDSHNGAMSVDLNTLDKEEYLELLKPIAEFCHNAKATDEKKRKAIKLLAFTMGIYHSGRMVLPATFYNLRIRKLIESCIPESLLSCNAHSALSEFLTTELRYTVVEAGLRSLERGTKNNPEIKLMFVPNKIPCLIPCPDGENVCLHVCEARFNNSDRDVFLGLGKVSDENRDALAEALSDVLISDIDPNLWVVSSDAFAQVKQQFKGQLIILPRVRQPDEPVQRDDEVSESEQEAVMLLEDDEASEEREPVERRLRKRTHEQIERSREEGDDALLFEYESPPNKKRKVTGGAEKLIKNRKEVPEQRYRTLDELEENTFSTEVGNGKGTLLPVEINEPTGNHVELTGDLWEDWGNQTMSRVVTTVQRVHRKNHRGGVAWPVLDQVQESEDSHLFAFNALQPGLKEYQKIAAARTLEGLRKHNIGRAICFEPGLGKTRTFSEVIMQWLLENKGKKVLVLVPKTCVSQTSTDIREVIQSTGVRGFCVSGFSDKKEWVKCERSNVLVTTTESLIGVLKKEGDDFIKSLPIDLVIFDEAQKGKNDEGTVYEVLTRFKKELRPEACLVPVTGTPMENNFNELISMLKLGLGEELFSKNSWKIIKGAFKKAVTSLSDSAVNGQLNDELKDHVLDSFAHYLHLIEQVVHPNIQFLKFDGPEVREAWGEENIPSVSTETLEVAISGVALDRLEKVEESSRGNVASLAPGTVKNLLFASRAQAAATALESDERFTNFMSSNGCAILHNNQKYFLRELEAHFGDAININRLEKSGNETLNNINREMKNSSRNKPTLFLVPDDVKNISFEEKREYIALGPSEMMAVEDPVIGAAFTIRFDQGSLKVESRDIYSCEVSGSSRGRQALRFVHKDVKITQVDGVEQSPIITQVLNHPLIQDAAENKKHGLIFYQYKMNGKSVAQELRTRYGDDLTIYNIDGSLTNDQRSYIVRSFKGLHGRKGGILLAQVKAGGVGLNLPEAEFVIWVTPQPYNPAVARQANARLRRIGHSLRDPSGSLRDRRIIQFSFKKNGEEKVLLERHIDSVYALKNACYDFVWPEGNIELSDRLHLWSEVLKTFVCKNFFNKKKEVTAEFQQNLDQAMSRILSQISDEELEERVEALFPQSSQSPQEVVMEETGLFNEKDFQILILPNDLYTDDRRKIAFLAKNPTKRAFNIINDMFKLRIESRHIRGSDRRAGQYMNLIGKLLQETDRKIVPKESQIASNMFTFDGPSKKWVRESSEASGEARCTLNF
jgi:ankyrin repeat protein